MTTQISEDRVSEQLGHNAAAVGEPRSYGLEVSHKF